MMVTDLDSTLGSFDIRYIVNDIQGCYQQLKEINELCDFDDFDDYQK